MGFREAGQKKSQAFRVDPSHITTGKLSRQEFSQLKFVL
jgi:hypothetical protein